MPAMRCILRRRLLAALREVERGGKQIDAAVDEVDLFETVSS